MIFWARRVWKMSLRSAIQEPPTAATTASDNMRGEQGRGDAAGRINWTPVCERAGEGLQPCRDAAGGLAGKLELAAVQTQGAVNFHAGG